MGLVTLPSFGTDPATVTAAGLDGKVDPLASEFNGSIENVNIKSGAAIAASKLNLATLAQSVAMSSKQFLWAKGADVASGTSIALGTDGNCFDITGTTTIQTITAKQAGSVVILHFDGALTLTDDTGNLELQGADLTVAAEDEVVLKSDGTNWHLVGHSARSGTLSGNNVWTGTQDFTSAVLLGASPLVFEGATADDFETTFAITDPTADRTITFPDEDVSLGNQCIKAWANFTGPSTPAYVDSFNFTGSITDNAEGDYTLTIDVDFANNDYAVMCCAHRDNSTTTNERTTVNFEDLAVGAINVIVGQQDGILRDANVITVALIGDR